MLLSNRHPGLVPGSTGQHACGSKIQAMARGTVDPGTSPG